jgi:hypothetical protein
VFDGGSTTLRLSRWVPGTAPRAVDPRGAPWGANWCGRTNGLLVVVLDGLDVLVVVLAPAIDGRLTTKPDSANVASSNRDRLTIFRVTAGTTLPSHSPDRVRREA